ncbi:hypothetical protein NP233_g1195 [Leucocoprinus birnbaumii]|uniref:Protein kinase domain-containing protein n=1 Tax=Leucocoprinus birnbaumii TaxID=56174 RepID=A0AAD5YZQ8_9AGAR|nr:hypothetical protein NP233_g1195 [Leucocoprinus birnbaumii]
MFNAYLNPKLTDLHSLSITAGTPTSRVLISPLSAALYAENRGLIGKAVRTLCEDLPWTSSSDYDDKLDIPDDALSSLRSLAIVFGLKDGKEGDEPRPNTFRDLYRVSQTSGSDQESRELRAFANTLEDGYILCKYLNWIRSKPVTDPVKPDYRVMPLASALDIGLDNLVQFLSVCTNLGIPEEELFDTRDFAAATNESMARVATTIIALSKRRKLKRKGSTLQTDTTSRAFIPVARRASLHQQAGRLHLADRPQQPRSLDDTRPVMPLTPVSKVDPQHSPFRVPVTLLSMIFREKDMYRRFLELRGQTAQMVIDTIKQIIDLRILSKEQNATFMAALLRLSLKSSLYPSCLVLKDVEREPFPCASGSFGDVYKGTLQGTSVCIKMVRVYKKSQIDQTLKVLELSRTLPDLSFSVLELGFFQGSTTLDEVYRRVCLISPWMENGNIREYLSANPQANRLLLTWDVLQGLRYLHDSCIVHGDLKGPNIFISPCGRARLSDFGLSCISDPNILQWTSLESSVSAGGTVRWKAPELIDPEEAGAPTKESDIYAFGCVCYEIFTGVVPFYEAIHDYSVIVSLMQGKKPSKPREDSDPYLCWGFTDTIWTVMKYCWEKNPHQRPTARDITNKLPRFPSQNRLNEARRKGETPQLISSHTVARENQVPDLPQQTLAFVPITPSSRMNSKGTSTILDVKVLSLLPVAFGGQSDILKGFWAPGNVLVAIKAYRGSRSDQAIAEAILQRTLRELNVLRQLDHPHIVTAYGLAYVQRYPGLVMPFCSNGNALDFLRQNPRADVLELVCGVVAGLEHIHNLNPHPLVHGDLKASNILIKDDHEPCLADFGDGGPVSRTTEPQARRTYRWTAAELLLHQDALPTTASDLWSCAMTILELFTQKPPFEQFQHDAQACLNIAQGLLPSQPSEIDDRIWALLGQCWAADPTKRPATWTVSVVLEIMAPISLTPAQVAILAQDLGQARPLLCDGTLLDLQGVHETELNAVRNSPFPCHWPGCKLSMRDRASRRAHRIQHARDRFS